LSKIKTNELFFYVVKTVTWLTVLLNI